MSKMKLVAFGHSLCDTCRCLSVINHLLLKVKQLPLEAWVGVNDTALRLNVAHWLEQTPVLLLHEVCDDAGGRSRLPCVTVNKIKKVRLLLIRFITIYLPVDEDGTTTFDCISDESHCCWQMLSDIFPGHIHHIDDLVGNFLRKSNIAISMKLIWRIVQFPKIDVQMESRGSDQLGLEECGWLPIQSGQGKLRFNTQWVIFNYLHVA